MNRLCILYFLCEIFSCTVHTCSVFLCLIPNPTAIFDFVFMGCDVCMYAYYVGFDVPTVVTVKNITLWIVTSYSQVEFHRCFLGIYCFHLQGRRTTGLQSATSLKIIHFVHHSTLCISINIVRKNKPRRI
jgi:hypothetical protein